MKVCLVTWLGTGNFGTSLQSYALHTKLSEMGYDVSILHSFVFDDFTFRGKLRKLLKSFKYNVVKYLKNNKLGSVKQRRVRIFNKENYNHKIINTRQQYYRLLQETDVFVTGSDQIWNCHHHFDPFYFLSFVGNSKRIAYASSIGTNKIPSEYELEVKSLLLKFQHIAVREHTAVSVINKLLGRTDVTQVVDPTFLLSTNHWQQFAADAKNEIALPDRFIFCYFVGNNKSYEQQIEDVKKHLGIDSVILVPALENSNMRISGAKIYDTAGPKEFVRLISLATCVCTDSFHATALSINLHKDFIEFKRFKDTDEKSQNSRIYDVLERYGLMHRIYDNQDSSLYTPIVYNDIIPVVLADCKQCSDYLKQSIEN